MKMNFKFGAFLFVAVGVISLYAAESTKVSRLTKGMVVVGGTSSTTGSSLVTSESTLNELKILQITATTSSVATASTNTFTTAFLAAPTFFIAPKSGSRWDTLNTNMTATATTTTLIISGLNTNSVNAPNILVYGYTRTGVLQ